MGVIVEADRQVEVIAANVIRSGADAEIYTRGADYALMGGSRILLQAKSLLWGGTAMAGADYSWVSGAASRSWTGKDSVLEIRADTSAPTPLVKYLGAMAISVSSPTLPGRPSSTTAAERRRTKRQSSGKQPRDPGERTGPRKR